MAGEASRIARVMASPVTERPRRSVEITLCLRPAKAAIPASGPNFPLTSLKELDTPLKELDTWFHSVKLTLSSGDACSSVLTVRAVERAVNILTSLDLCPAISVPVLDRDGRVVAAVSILGPESRLAPEVLRRYAAALKNEIRPLLMVIPDSTLFRPRKG